MPFATIRGQTSAISVLQRMLVQGRVPGALLFLGRAHVGKRTAGLALAQALNCERLAPHAEGAPATSENSDACGICLSCRKIEAGTHPDVEVVSPDGQTLKIDQIRAVTERLALNPTEARRRVIVLAGAERMNPQAANAFLKTLEEPPPDTTLVLCATEAALLPETIVSRCLPVRFAPLSVELLQDLYRTSGKSAKRGQRDADEGDGAEAAQVLEFAVRFAQGSLRPELMQGRATEWYTLREDVLAALSGLMGPDRRPDSGDLVGERLTRFSAKESAGFVLEWLETWWRDVAVLAAGGDPARLINGDRREALAPWPLRMGLRNAEMCHRRVLALQDALDVNVNAALAFEGLWLEFKQLLHEAGRTSDRAEGPAPGNSLTGRSR